MNIKDIMVATKKDHQLHNAISNIQSGKWTKASDLFSVRHELSVTNNGLLLRDSQIVMPSKGPFIFYKEGGAGGFCGGPPEKIVM